MPSKPRARPVKRCTICGRAVDASISFAPRVASDSGYLTYKQVIFDSLRCLREWADGLEWRNETKRVVAP